MDIGAYSIAQANQSLAYKVSVSVAKMSMDIAKSQTADMVKLIDSVSSNVKSPADTGGRNIDISI